MRALFWIVLATIVVGLAAMAVAGVMQR